MTDNYRPVLPALSQPAGCPGIAAPITVFVAATLIPKPNAVAPLQVKR